MLFLGDLYLKRKNGIKRSERSESYASQSSLAPLSLLSLAFGMAASWILPSEKTVTITVGERRVLQPLREITQAEPVNMNTAEEGKEDWREPFETTSRTEGYLKTVGPKYEGSKFIMWKDALYKRSLDGIYMRCIAKERIPGAMQEVHAGVRGAHQTGPK